MACCSYAWVVEGTKWIQCSTSARLCKGQIADNCWDRQELVGGDVGVEEGGASGVGEVESFAGVLKVGAEGWAIKDGREERRAET
jgi:hypothetical protein